MKPDSPYSHPNEGTCRSGQHPWTEENIQVLADGSRYCKPCRRESQANPSGHRLGVNHCKRGHAYTPENTRKRVRVIKGKKVIQRECIRCQKDQLRTRR